ncbi:hypothetical protein EYC80_003070 [Monilinia laxa]|nr:hypothetical protein EYC80_003070 [Monilinia laxa]
MDSSTSPNSPIFPTPGVVSLNSSMSSNNMMETSFFGLPLHEQTGYKDFMGAGHRGEMTYCFDPWDQTVGRFGDIVNGIEDGGRVMVKREETYDEAYGFF